MNGFLRNPAYINRNNQQGRQRSGVRAIGCLKCLGFFKLVATTSKIRPVKKQSFLDKNSTWLLLWELSAILHKVKLGFIWCTDSKHQRPFKRSDMDLLKIKSKGGTTEDGLKLATGLTAKEFCCKHGSLVINEDFMRQYDKARIAYGKPLRINSGFRCKECQDDLIYLGITQTRDSFHSQGEALDLAPMQPTRENILELFDCLLDFRYELRIGVYKWGIHVDLGDPERPELSRLWFNIKGHYQYINGIWT